MGRNIKPEFFSHYMTVLFPHEKIRPVQNELIEVIQKGITDKEHVFVHAPTGLGKTAAALAPAVSYALENDKTVFFLTSRHTQHKIAIETLRKMNEKYPGDIKVADIIGRKNMCIQGGIENLYAGEFLEYCRSIRESGKCLFYSNVREGAKLSVKAKNQISIMQKNIYNTEDIIQAGIKDELCPYELATELAKQANIIIADYHYLFHPHVRTIVMARIEKELKDCVVVIDEAHNLPYRVRDLASVKITSIMTRRAIKEAKKNGYDHVIPLITDIQNALLDLSKDLDIGKEKLVKKEDFVKRIETDKNYEEIFEELEHVATAIRQTQKQSFIGGVALFLEFWNGKEEGFTRIISMKPGKQGEYISLSYRCLDPAVISKEVIEATHSSIFMSGTLMPTSMFKDLLGVEEAIEKEFENPFPDKNRLNLVIPKTTTKYTHRTPEMFKQIAANCTQIANTVPGNSLMFFPSYAIRDQVHQFMQQVCNKTLFLELPNMTKQEKEELLEKFKKYKDSGAVLLCAVSGNYGEGIDLPGDFVKSVTIVGLPLGQPDLETKQLIEYFDKKYSKGWDYGYIFPAFNKTLQNAGRCIRSETDKGAVIFLDERYLWPMYKRCFPHDWDMEVSRDIIGEIEEFFGN